MARYGPAATVLGLNLESDGKQLRVLFVSAGKLMQFKRGELEPADFDPISSLRAKKAREGFLAMLLQARTEF